MYKVGLDKLVEIRNRLVATNKLLVDLPVTEELEKVILDNLATIDYLTSLIGETNE